MLAASKKLDLQITDLQKQRNELPPGKLVCTRNQNRYKWYQSDGHHLSYIPKKNLQLAQTLAQKKYLDALLADLSAKQLAIQFYLKHYPKTNHLEQLLTHPEIQTLLAPYFTPLSQELSDWMYTSYPTNPKYPEQRIHKSSSGTLVRSKSEAMIDMFLYTNHIPFRYEALLQLGEINLYPDFTIRHPKTGDYYYWEHFGMMDIPAYAKNAASKLDLYISHGIIPSIHLITTFETKEHPLTIDTISKLISHYFL